MKQGAARYSAYRITWSTTPGMEVGKILVEAGNELNQQWEFLDRTSGEMTGVAAERIAVLCPDCVKDFKYAGAPGHEGGHGAAGGAPRAPELVALTGAAKAKEQVGG